MELPVAPPSWSELIDSYSNDLVRIVGRRRTPAHPRHRLPDGPADLLGLVKAGLLDQHRQGKAFVFVARPDLDKKLRR
jgi:hypothetical protein